MTNTNHNEKRVTGWDIAVRRARWINKTTATRVIEDEHGHAWADFENQCPHAITWRKGAARIRTRAVFNWLGY